MNYTQAHLRRRNNVMKWYAPARFGLFYHWGLFTGGGNTSHVPGKEIPLSYNTPAEFEAAAGDPRDVAEKMVANAVACGAKYITLTMLHSCEALCVLSPTRVPGFRYKTKKDYIGAFIHKAHKNGIRPLLYMPCCADNWDSVSMGPCVDESLRTENGYAEAVRKLVSEIYLAHKNELAGFWLDGMNPAMRSFPAFLHGLSPELIVINNNNTSLDIDDVDFGASEFIGGTPEPPYCRPNALKRIARCSVSIPGRDFNEDIPTCCDWWDHGDNAFQKHAEPYLADRHFLLKQMLSGLGQRGQWNFTFGIGPRIDGSLPPEFEPMFAVLHEFMKWGAESIYNTTGGQDSQIVPGWFTAPWSPQGFCSVTRRLDDPAVHYILVTEAPACDSAHFHTGGLVPRRITDLRSGTEIPFRMLAGILLNNIDWSDVTAYGVKAFKVEF